MQLADAYKYGIVLFLGYLVVFGFWRMFPVKYEHYPLYTITDVAKRDLSVVGKYDDRFVTSLRFLLECIYQKLYHFKGIPFSESKEMLLKWRVSNTYDPSLKIEKVINSVCSDLEKRWEEYAKLKQEDDTEPFNVQLSDTDLPYPASTLRCNDHIDTESLHALYYEVLKKELV